MKPTQKEPEEYKKLTGDPGLTAVSDAAKGKTPHTFAEFEQISNEEAGARRVGSPITTKGADCDDIEEAYAMLFEGLARIARSHSQEEASEEVDSSHPDSGHPDGCSCGGC